MSLISCPKCLYHEHSYKAPLGKVVRNPYADLTRAVYDDCNACEGSGYVPDLIIEAIRNTFPRSAQQCITGLRWSGDHWSFNIHGMYVGVERDGYVHS